MSRTAKAPVPIGRQALARRVRLAVVWSGIGTLIGCGGDLFRTEKPPPAKAQGPSAAATEQPALASAPETRSGSSEPAAPQAVEWTAFGYTHRIQAIEVRLVEAKLESIPTAPGEESEGPTQALLVRVRIENKAVTREVPFEGWYKQASPPLVRLVDDKQKSYRLIPFPGPLAAGDPKLKAEGKTLHDLAFEPPDTAARVLHLELPGQRLGLSEPFRFEIPVAQIRPPAASGGVGGGQPAEKDKNEENAARRLKFAKQFLDQNKPQDAREYLEDILKRWPETESAKEAKKLLERLKK